nr:copper resistance protein [Escherichia coli]
MSIKNDGHYFCRAGGNRPDGLNEPVTDYDSVALIDDHIIVHSKFAQLL